jgi:hypothetical protein
VVLVVVVVVVVVVDFEYFWENTWEPSHEMLEGFTLLRDSIYYNPKRVADQATRKLGKYLALEMDR